MKQFRNLLRMSIAQIADGGMGVITVDRPLRGYVGFTAGDDATTFDITLTEGARREVFEAVYTHASRQLSRGALLCSTEPAGTRIAFSRRATAQVVLAAQSINAQPQASEVQVQPVRTGNYTFTQEDAGSVMPVSATASITVPAGLTGFMAQILRYDAGTLTVTPGSGVILYYGGDRITSISAAEKGAWILVIPGSTANEYFLRGSGDVTAVLYSAPAPAPAGPDTRPRWFNAPSTAASTGTQAFLDGATKFGSNGGKAGGFTPVTTPGNFGWLAHVASAGTPTFTHIATGASGGWVAQGNVTAAGGTVYALWRMDYPNTAAAPQPTTPTWSIG